MTPTQPRTKAGKALLVDLVGTTGMDEEPAIFTDRDAEYRDSIAAIEEEAVSEYRNLLEKYEELVQRFHAAAYDDPDMQSREWERRLNGEWDDLDKARSLLDRSGVTTR